MPGRFYYNIAMQKILIAEDDALTMHVLQTFLSSQKFEVTPAGDGQEALQLLDGGGFDLVISDIQMQPMDGLVFLKEARKKGNNIPFIIMTARPKMDSYIHAMHELGAFEYIQKPLDLDTLMLVIDRLMAGK